ncbi:U3 small nucleolar RNA-associated protein, partial [Coemansia sp. S610]
EPNCVYAYSASHITRIDLNESPGPRGAVLNVHKRKQIEKDIIAKVLEEKMEVDKRSEKQAKRKRKQSVGSQINGQAAMDVDADADAPSIGDQAEALANDVDELYKGKDWESTVVARFREAGIDADSPNNFRMTQRYQNLMHASFIDRNTMVVIERPWIDVAATLPSAYHRHKYGA